MLKRQWSNEKPSGNKKPQKKGGTVANEDSGTVPASENWETEEESVVPDDSKGSDVQMVSVTINQLWVWHASLILTVVY